MRRLLIALVALVVILLVGDFVAKAYAATQLKDRARAAVRGSTSSDGSITSFPFLGRLLLFGRVQEVKVSVGPVVAGRVTFSSIAVDLHDVHVDRNQLIKQRTVRLTGLGSGTVTAVLTDAEISRLAGVPLTFTPGRVNVTVHGVSVSGAVQVENGILVLGNAASPVRVRIPRAPLFACDATSAVVQQGQVEASCTIHDIPPELVRRVSAAA